MTQCTLYLAGSFLMSAVLNYFLAKYFIRSETGSPEFVQEMGAMTFWSYPIIMVPSMIVMIFALNQLINGIQKYTDFDLDDILIVGRSNDIKPVADEG